MAFVGEDQGIVGQVFEQSGRRLAGFAPRQPAGIVLDAGAAAGGLDHLQVKGGALFQALGFQQLSLGAHVGQGGDQLGLDAFHGLLQRGARRHIVAVGVDLDGVQGAGLVARQRIELGDAVHRVAEQLDAPGAVFLVGGEDVHHVAAHSESTTREVVVVAAILQRDQVLDGGVAVYAVAARDADGGAGIGFHRADAIDARH